jgi:hypothetical protein
VTDDQATDEQQQDEKQEQPEDERQQPEDEQRSGEESGDDGGAGGDDEVAKARKAAEEEEKAKEKVKELEEDPPEKLEDWPDDKAKYETFGGAEGDESYEESVTSKLGPSSLRFREDGGVEIEGEEVDDPDEYKSEPIPGGPTDPRISDARAYGEPDLTDETSIDAEAAVKGEDEASGGDDSGDESGGEGDESGGESDDTQ